MVRVPNRVKYVAHMTDGNTGGLSKHESFCLCLFIYMVMIAIDVSMQSLTIVPMGPGSVLWVIVPYRRPHDLEASFEDGTRTRRPTHTYPRTYD